MIHPGHLAAVALLGLVVASLTGLFLAGGKGADLVSIGPYVLSLVRGAAWQASLSTFLSLLAGAALALALLRRPVFPGRSLLMALLGAATVAPAIVVVFGMVAVYGRQGYANALLGWTGFSFPSIYGLHGIVLAHVLLNAPFIARALLVAFGREPAERSRLALALGFAPRDMFRLVDWPVLRREMPGLAVLTFLLCFTSFAIVLALGGGPANATLEVAIYEALRVDADFARAATLAGVQLVLSMGLVFLLAATQVPMARSEDGVGRQMLRPDAAFLRLRLFDAATILLVILFVAPPLLSVLDGVSALPMLLGGEALIGLRNSVLLALAAGALATLLALLLALAARPLISGQQSGWRMRLPELVTFALLGLPPMAFVAGLYVLLRGSAPPEMLGIVLVPLVNALMALPFAWRLLAPAVQASQERHGRLAASLGLTGIARLRLVDAAALRAPALAAFALGAALSFGDYGVISLFGGGDLVTLPSLLAERLGSYRMQEAAAYALPLVAGAALLAYGADRAAKATP
ncbi:MAG: thiamine/thiamine pyrophosphate ABC transporter permease ThiP [Bosea sp. (in: a-proteobacteria)]